MESNGLWRMYVSRRSSLNATKSGDFGRSLQPNFLWQNISCRGERARSAAMLIIAHWTFSGMLQSIHRCCDARCAKVPSRTEILITHGLLKFIPSGEFILSTQLSTQDVWPHHCWPPRSLTWRPRRDNWSRTPDYQSNVPQRICQRKRIKSQSA